LRPALHAMGPAFPLARADRPRPFHRERDLLVAAPVARARAELLDPQAAPVGVPGQHPVEIAGPQRGLVAADALADLDDRVFVVVRICRDERLAQRRLELGNTRLELRAGLLQVALGA